jgi:hypothetical protein
MFRNRQITPARRKQEGVILGICILGALVLDAVSLLVSRSPIIEMITGLYLTLLLGLVFYGAVVVLRVLYYLVSRFWLRK